MRVDEASGSINSPNAIGIAIGGKAGVSAVVRNSLLKLPDVRLHRLRVKAAKERIGPAVNLLTANSVARAQGREIAARRAEHGICDEMKVPLRDTLQIDDRFNVLQVSLAQIAWVNGCRARRRRNALAISRSYGGQTRFHLLNDLGSGRAAVAGLELESVPLPRIVAGGDYDRPGGLLLAHGERNGRGRHERFESRAGMPAAAISSAAARANRSLAKRQS